MTTVTPMTSITSRPPRSVPRSAKLVVMLNGSLAWPGWIFVGIGTLFTLISLGNSDFSSLIYFRGPLASAPGTILTIKQTNATEGGQGRHLGTPVYQYTYQFSVGNKAYQGTSYYPGHQTDPGQPVTIEFPAKDPSHSRIAGMNLAAFGIESILVLIFPLLGVGTLAWMMVSNRRNLQLLIHGEAAMGKCIKKEWTSWKINNQQAYKIWFEYRDAVDIPRRAYIWSMAPDIYTLEAFQDLLYNPQKPSSFLPVFQLPKGAVPDNHGVIPGCSLWMILVKLLPILIAALLIMAGVAMRPDFR